MPFIETPAPKLDSFVSLMQRSINGTAKVESEARAVLKDIGVAGLIAQPMN